MDLYLEGKTALVTGGSRGIGYAICESLLNEGCNLVVVSRDQDRLTTATNALRQKFPDSEIRIKSGDLKKQELITQLAVEFPETGILVNNAGAIPHGSLVEVDDESWRDGWELKVFSQIRMTRAFYAPMKHRGGGVVINVIGVAGERLMSNYICGSSGNAALIAFTKAVGSTSPADGIRVVGVNPGPILTDRLRLRLKQRAQEELGDPERWEELVKSYPFGRPGDPVEVANTVTFLASPRAGYISGSIVNVEGGMANWPVDT